MGFSVGVNTLKEEISAEEVFAISGILTKIKFHEKFHGSFERFAFLIKITLKA